MAESTSRRPLQAILLVGVVAMVLLVAFLLVVPLGSSDSTTVGGHPLMGKEAPEIDLLTLDGEQVTLSELRGQPVLVNFWATWCLPCREEFPLMVAAYAEHAEDGFEILGVVHDDTVAGARAFAADMNAKWAMLDDVDDVAWQDYTGVGMPTSIFVDVDGIVRAFSLGGFTQEGLAAQLETILPPSTDGGDAPSA